MAPELQRPDLALHGALSANLIGFCRLLRQQGIGLGPGEELDALRALERLGVDDRDRFRAALRTTLVKSPREQSIFDQFFETYWQVWDRAGELNKPVPEEKPAQSTTTRPKVGAAPLDIRDWLKRGETPEEDREAAGYSPFAVVTKRDFADFDAADLDEVSRLIAALSKALATRFNRRYQPARKGARLDLRRSMRWGLKYGGDLIELAFRRRRRQKLSLVMLCDVSKSMDLYSRFLIQFVYGFQRAYRRLETFAFSTALHRITPVLRQRDLAQVLRRLPQVMPEWSGGTRIGGNFAEFSRTARRFGRQTHGRTHSQRRLGHRRGRPAGRADAPVAAPRPLPGVAQPADGQRFVRAHLPRHAGGPALHRHFRPGPQRRQPAAVGGTPGFHAPARLVAAAQNGRAPNHR